MLLFALPLRPLGSRYDPAARRVTLGPQPSRFELAHERAHEQQHQTRHPLWLLWRLHQRRRTPYVARWTRILLELHATWHALLALHRCRLLDRQSLHDAATSTRSYLGSLWSREQPATASESAATATAASSPPTAAESASATR